MGIIQKLRERIAVDLFRAELATECGHSLEPCGDCANDARADRW